MTDIFRVRIDRRLVKEATKIAEQIGTTPGELVRIFFKQLVKRKGVPFPLEGQRESEADLVDVNRRNRIWRELDDAEDW